MRYILVVVAIIVSIAAVMLVASRGDSQRPSSMAYGAVEATATAFVVVPPKEGLERAVMLAESAASLMGEKNPVQIDAGKLSLQQALEAVNGVKEGPPWVDLDKEVYLVGMAGSFVPPRQRAGETPLPTVGWMYSIVDATTGEPMSNGFGAGTPPVLPAAP